MRISPPSAYVLMAFTLIYRPCLATIGVIKREMGSWRWILFTVLYELTLAHVVELIIVGTGGRAIELACVAVRFAPPTPPETLRYVLVVC